VNVSLEVPGNTDAVIHYTLYPGNPINITSPVTIRAFGLKNCSVSPETSASYPTGQLPPVVFDPPGSCSLPASVSLSVPGYPEATIHYTVNGDTPTSLSPTYTGPLSITMPTLIKAFARKNGCPDSIVTSAFFGGARNGNQLPINDGGTASCNPSCYPSTIIVSCGAVTISKITVTLYKVSHTWPDDLDILLVGPGGQKLMLMSDAGGNRPFPLNNVTIAFDDDAASPLPDAAQIVSGTYRAADYESPETMPTPAPGRPYSTTLSVFNGTTPNGTWSLYVADDSRGDTGSIAEGWSIAFTFAP
jgi:subtilisin-like proprotein convertase family protein